MSVEPSGWDLITAQNPNHSIWYRDRFRSMAANGDDIVGEARLADALAGRGARILDAGCGGGRLGGYLAGCGHTVVGVDGDPVLIEAAGQDYPGPTWLLGDLALLDLPSQGIASPFDLIVCAGNVMTFLAPSTRQRVLANFAGHLTAEGRAVIGFGAGRGYDFTEFLADAQAGGLAPQQLASTWDLRPFTPDSGFLVAILGRK